MKKFSLVCLGLLLSSSALGCAADVAPTNTGDHGPALAEQPAEVQILSGEESTEEMSAALFSGHHVCL